jgi:hypothetical protein
MLHHDVLAAMPNVVASGFCPARLELFTGVSVASTGTGARTYNSAETERERCGSNFPLWPRSQYSHSLQSDAGGFLHGSTASTSDTEASFEHFKNESKNNNAFSPDLTLQVAAHHRYVPDLTVDGGA